MNAIRRLAVLALVALSFLFGAREVHAQTTDLSNRLTAQTSRDLVDRVPPGSLTIPALPPDYVSERRGPLTISYPRALRAVVEPALRTAERNTRAMAAQFGMREVPPLAVRLVADPDAMRRLAPQEVPPPFYAVGVAYPAVRLALVSATEPRTAAAAPMAQVLHHELSHLLFAEATNHAALPRWLTEGIAVHQADENTFERFQALASASWTGRLLPLRRLDEGFSESTDEVNAAYAEATDFVGWMLRKDGNARFAIFIDHLREGLSLDEALTQTYGASAPHLEEEWRSDLDGRVAFAPLWAGTGLLSIGGAVLVVAALVRRRLKNRDTLQRWEREENQRRSRWMFLVREPRKLTQPDAPADDAAPRPRPTHLRLVREELPRVQHEGSEHTLH